MHLCADLLFQLALGESGQTDTRSLGSVDVVSRCFACGRLANMLPLFVHVASANVALCDLMSATHVLCKYSL